MIKEIVWYRLLYVGATLIAAVAALLTIIVIPLVMVDESPNATPENAIPVISIIVIVHLLLIAALLKTIKLNKKGRKINKELLVGVAVILIVFSLLILDGAFAYFDHPGMLGVSISMFVCVVLDFVAGLLIFIARYSKRPQLKSK